MNGDKFLIAEYVDKNRDNIITKYEQGMSITTIAKLYNVAYSTIYFRLVKWGVKIYSTIYFRLVKWGVKIRKHGGARRKKGRPARPKRKFSPEFLAHQVEITRLNEGKIKYISFQHSTEDQKLIDNILNRPIIG